jgi:hypothetical protein
MAGSIRNVAAALAAAALLAGCAPRGCKTTHVLHPNGCGHPDRRAVSVQLRWSAGDAGSGLRRVYLERSTDGWRVLVEHRTRRTSPVSGSLSRSRYSDNGSRSPLQRESARGGLRSGFVGGFVCGHSNLLSGLSTLTVWYRDRSASISFCRSLKFSSSDSHPFRYSKRVSCLIWVFRRRRHLLGSLLASLTGTLRSLFHSLYHRRSRRESESAVSSRAWFQHSCEPVRVRVRVEAPCQRLV